MGIHEAKNELLEYEGVKDHRYLQRILLFQRTWKLERDDFSLNEEEVLLDCLFLFSAFWSCKPFYPFIIMCSYLTSRF